MTKNTILHKPGEDNQPKGEYLEVGKCGGAVRNARQVTVTGSSFYISIFFLLKQ